MNAQSRGSGPLLNPRGRTGHGGFTLIELTVVILIILLMAVVLLPRIEFGDSQRLRNEAVHLRNTLDWAQGQTLYTGQPHRLVVDISRQLYRIERRAEEGYELVASTTVKERKLRDKQLRIVWDSSLGDESAGQVIAEFSPWGPLRPISLILSAEGGDEHLRISFFPGSPRATLADVPRQADQ